MQRAHFQVGVGVFNCQQILTKISLEGIENKQRLQTLSIDNAWSNKFLLDHALSMDNVCNRCLFSIPSTVEMAEEQEY